MPLSHPPLALVSLYVVLVGRGRRPGIYDDWDAAEAQTSGFSNGRTKKFRSLDEAFAYWAANVPDAAPELHFHHTSPARQERGTAFYVRDGLVLRRDVGGAEAETIVALLRGSV